MDYGRRHYGSPPGQQTVHMSEITDQYIYSLAIDYPFDFKQPYMNEDYQSMIYLFNAPFQSSYLTNQNWYGGGAPGFITPPILPTPYPTPYSPPPVPWPQPPPTEPKPPPLRICPDSVNFDCPDNVALGSSYQFTVSGGSKRAKFQWDIISGRGTGSITPTGLYRAPLGGDNCDSPATIALQCAEQYIYDDETGISDPDWKTIGTCNITLGTEPCSAVISIGFTTQQMSANDTQDLHIHDGGTNICGIQDFTWEVTSGGGSINVNGTYTAPSSNENCTNNPTISLLCNGTMIDTLDIAINSVSGGGAAYVAVSTATSPTQCHSDGNPDYSVGDCGSYNRSRYRCDGVYVNAYDLTNCGGSIGCWTGGEFGNPDCCTNFMVTCTPFGDCEPATVDLRTESQLLAGCCPEALL
jgi:hypothetical protein